MNRKNTKIAVFLIALTLLASCSQKSEVAVETETAAPVEQTTAAVNNEINTAVTTESIASNVIVEKQRYELPGGKGEEELEFRVTMNGWVIESVEVSNLNTNKLSPPQQNFADAVNQAVKGKAIKDVRELATIGGSSLTTEAFKEALR